MDRKIRLTVNGTARAVEIPTYRTLLDCLRNDLGLTGSKEGCGVGVCGACTVLLDGKMISSCIALAVSADGHEVTTVEGLAGDERLHPVQQAFIDAGGFQCGICTRARSYRPRRCSCDPEPERRRDPGMDARQSLPVHRLLQDHRVDSDGRSAEPGMNAFEYAAPRTLDEALAVLREHGDEARVIAGGTALVTMMRQRLVSPGYLVSLREIPGLGRIEVANGGVRIGALVTHREVETSPSCASGFQSSLGRSVV